MGADTDAAAIFERARMARAEAGRLHRSAAASRANARAITARGAVAGRAAGSAVVEPATTSQMARSRTAQASLHAALERAADQIAHQIRALPPPVAGDGGDGAWRGGGENPLPLTTRQLEILRMLAAGQSTEAIARELWLSVATVRNHVARTLRALDAHTRLEAIAKARALGLL
jgi:DNA-binding NarL/FixJ family response regulator